MAIWNENITTDKANEINAGSGVRTTTENRGRTGDVDETAARLVELQNGFDEIDVIGINTGEINNMVSAIQTYTKAVKDHLDGIDPSTNADKAFTGKEVQSAVKKYVEQVKTYCKNLTSQLNEFCDKLVDIKETYIANKEELASNITNEAAFDAGSEYSYQKISK